MVTIYDIARETGVSPNTVARILSGRRGRPYNMAKVLSAARKHGYVRNQQAANLRTGRSNLFGVIVPDIQNPHYPGFYQQIHALASANGYQVLLASTFSRVEEEIQALRLFEVNRVCGIILNVAEGESDESCDAMLEAFVNRDVPVIVCGRHTRGLPVHESRVNNIDGAARAMAYLYKTGRRRIAFLAGTAKSMSTQERLEGYRRGLKAQGQPEHAELIVESDFTIAGGRNRTRELLDLPQPPDAILAANDLMAIGAMQTARDRGISIPQDLAVIGFGDNPLSDLVSPRLTSIRIPTEQIARDCVNILLSCLSSNPPSSPCRMEYDPELIVRESA